MKDGWQTKQLAEITAKEKFAIVDGPFGTQLHKSDYRATGIPLVRINNITWENAFDDSKLVYISSEKFAALQRSAVRPGDILLAKTGATIGKVAIFPDAYLEGLIASSCAKISLDNDKALARFVMLFLASDDGLGQIVHSSYGATRPVLNLSQIKDLEIPLPSLSEQRRLVNLLDEAFASIAAAKASAEKNLLNARALFDSHLQSIFTRRGKGWVEKRLAEVAKVFGRGKSKHRPRNEPKLYNGPYPFIQTGDISNADHWLVDYTQTYSEAGLAQSRLWPKGTICIAIVGATVGETAILSFESCFPDSVIGIVVNEESANNEYVEFLLQAFKVLLKEKGKGTARDNINLGTFEDQRFPFPDLNRQNDIVTTLNALREETQRLETIYRQKLAALDELKKSLLHQAFSGNL
jgi:type I restriction enzyme S subunit